VVNDPKTELLQRAYGAGFYYTGLFAGRPQDMLGFATSVVKVNDRWNTSRRAANASNGINDYNNPGYLPLADKENTTELFYRFNATKWLSVQPNLQYIKAPGGVKDVPSATVLGLRFNLSI
jgi:porin